MKIGATKKIVVSSVTLLAALGVAAGSTFAWFASNTTVTVDGFSSQIVSGSDSLTIAVTAADNTDYIDLAYGQTVSESQIRAVVSNDNNDPVYLAPLTPTDATATAFKTEAGNEEAEANSLVESEGGYVSYRLVFRDRAQTAGNRYIALATDSEITKSANAGKSIPYSTVNYPVISSDPDNNQGFYRVAYHLALSDNHYGDVTITDDKPLATGEDDARVLNAYAAYAARVAFVSETQTGRVWSPYERYTDGSNTEDATKTVNSKARGHYLNNLASDYRLDYFNLTSATTAIKAYTQAAYTNYIDSNATDLEDRRVSDNLKTVTGSEFLYTSIIINIWLEGTDGDCFDAVLTDAFTTSLKFSVEVAADSGTTDETEPEPEPEPTP